MQTRILTLFKDLNSDISSSESWAREETWQALHWGLSSGEQFLTIVSNWESYNNIDAVMWWWVWRRLRKKDWFEGRWQHIGVEPASYWGAKEIYNLMEFGPTPSTFQREA